jgi:integrase
MQDGEVWCRKQAMCQLTHCLAHPAGSRFSRRSLRYSPGLGPSQSAGKCRVQPSLVPNLSHAPMPTLEKRKRGWRARVRRHGQEQSATFPTKQQAAAWALEREAEATGTKLPDKTFGDALARYARDVAPTHKGARWELVRLKSLQDEAIAKRPLAVMAAPDFAEWRDARLKKVSPGTVAREMTLIRSMLRLAVREWHWLKVSPMADVKLPEEPASRKRRISQDEADRIMLACGVTDTEHGTAMQRTGLAFAFALETAMRAGEIVGMQWPDVAEKSVRLPRTKNGDERRVPLSPRAREIIAALPHTDRPVFDLDPGTRDVMFRRAKDAAKVENLRFHDSRAEAIWRLSKKLDVLELARVIGHRDPRSLMLYYQADADELADRL